MPSKAWQTNATARIGEFVERETAVEEDLIELTRFARRLSIDPYDIHVAKSLDGEWFHRIGKSATRPSRDLAVACRIDVPHRFVDVISFFSARRPHRDERSVRVGNRGGFRVETTVC